MTVKDATFMPMGIEPGKNTLLVNPLTVGIPERIFISGLAAARDATSPDIRAIAERISHSERCDPGSSKCALGALMYVAEFKKVRDPIGWDMMATPVDVLRAGAGDCLTLCTLLVSILLAMKFTASLQRMCLPGDEDHVVVRAWVDGKFVSLDPTAESPGIDVISSIGRTGTFCSIWGED